MRLRKRNLETRVSASEGKFLVISFIPFRIRVHVRRAHVMFFYRFYPVCVYQSIFSSSPTLAFALLAVLAVAAD